MTRIVIRIYCHVYLYFIFDDCNFKGNSFNRDCSEDCAKLIWIDSFKYWAHEHGYSKFFE